MFINALAQDVGRHFRAHTPDPFDTTTLLLMPHELQTVGVVFALLRSELSGNVQSEVGPWTVANLSRFVQDFPNKERLPIFFLDEVLPQYDYRDGRPRIVSSELRLARNLLSAVGLVSVLMGTNSSAANFISAASTSLCGETKTWCQLVTCLPRPNVESLRTIGAEDVINSLKVLPLLASICPFLAQQFQSCTPWFIELFVKVVTQEQMLQNHPTAMSAIEFLDRVLCIMAKRVDHSKGDYNRQSFRRAQFCYHLEPLRKPRCLTGEILSNNGSAEEETEMTGEGIVSREDRTVFVSSHFASLDESDCYLSIHQNNLSKNMMTPWLPTASFQRARDDSFLYLMLGGGDCRLDFPTPFSSPANPRMTTLETFWSLKNDHSHNSSGTVIPTENIDAERLDGAALEVIAAVAVEIASHRRGLGGIDVAEFLLQLATELLPSYQPLEWIHPSAILQSLGEKRVPYLSAAGDSWPDTFRSIQGVNWGHLFRTKDQDQIDLKIHTAQNPSHPEISAECKNYKNGLNGEVLREILARIPSTSWLHLVICPHMQQSYWSAQTQIKWDTFKSAHHLEESALLRVVKAGSTLTLKPLFTKSVPETRAHKLVVFFPIAGWSH